MINFGVVKPGSTLRIPFDTFAAATGAPAALSAFAAADILIYKDGNVTERASTAGYTATTTFDTITGINEAVIVLSDDTTADFFKAGSNYVVVISPVTIDAQTVAFVAATFTIGYPNAVLNTSIATLASQTSFTLTDGPAENDALNGMWAIVHDKASAVQLTWVQILDYTGATKTVTLAATPPATFTIAAIDNFSVMGVMPLQPTITGSQEVVQTGDSFARLGAPAGASVSADLVVIDNFVDDIEARLGTPSNLGSGATVAANLVDIEGQTDDIGTAGAGLTAVPWNAAWDAEVQSEVDDALVVHRLDELVNADSDIDGAAPPTVGSVFHELLTKTAGSFTYDQTTDSLEAVRDNMGTAQTGDSYAIVNSGAHGNAALKVLIDAIDDFVDTEVAAILAAVDTEVGAIKTQTDKMIFTVANQLDSNVLSVNGTAAAAARLALASANMLPGTVDITGFAPTTTQFEADDITLPTADRLKGRIIVFTSGAGQYEATDITAYSLVGGRGHFTVTALASAPADNVTFIVI
jgi:hypothetical protein